MVFQAAELVLEEKKFDLLRAVQDTQRGLVATSDQRSCIEEALVSFCLYLHFRLYIALFWSFHWQIFSCSSKQGCLCFILHVKPLGECGVLQRWCTNWSKKIRWDMASAVYVCPWCPCSSGICSEASVLSGHFLFSTIHFPFSCLFSSSWSR